MIFIRLNDFRSYEGAHAYYIPDQVRIIILDGNNGIGKTNFLEAVSLMDGSKGLRGASWSEMIHNSKNSWKIELVDQKQQFNISLKFCPITKQRRIYQHGIAITPGQLRQEISIICLNDNFVHLFEQSPTEQRRFFDKMMLNLLPQHTSALNNYIEWHQQRMDILNKLQFAKNSSQGFLSNMNQQLDFIEERLSFYVPPLLRARDQYTKALNKISSSTHTNKMNDFLHPLSEISWSLVGEIEQLWNNTNNSDDFCNILKKNFYLERTIYPLRHKWGLHKSQLQISIKKNNQTHPVVQLSKGEQKTTLLFWLLTQARLIKESFQTSVTPKYLWVILDEALTHLDSVRMSSFFQLLLDMNIYLWLSGIEFEQIRHMKNLENYWILSQYTKIHEEENNTPESRL